MRFFRRPLLVVFISLIVLIRIWYWLEGEGTHESVFQEGQPVECVGRIEEIQVRASGSSIILSGIKPDSVNAGDKQENQTFLIYNSAEQDLFQFFRPGNKLKVKGTGYSFEAAGNPGEFDELSYYGSRGIDGKIFADSADVLDGRYDYVKYALFMLRQKAVEKLFAVMEEADAGILSAMLLGDKTNLPEEEKELYQRTGIGHMLVISGLHVTLLAAGLFFFLRSYIMPMRQAVVVTVLFLFMYGQFTGFEVATARAVLMMCCVLFARYTGRCYDALSALSFGGIITLVSEPVQLFQCGFLLSYTSVFGIVLFAPVMDRMKLKSTWGKSLFSSASVCVVTLPVMLWFYYEICPYSVIANMIVLPFLSLLVGVGTAGCLVSFFWPAGGEFVLATAHYILAFYKLVCRLVSGLPASTIVTGRPPVWCIVLYYTILAAAVVLYLRWEKRRWLYTGAVLLFVCLLFRQESLFLYTQLDVGQGDCACIFYKDKTFLIDGGSSSEKEIGKYTIRNFLKFYGRTDIDGVFVTHSDADHTNGIAEIVENKGNWGISVGSVIFPDIQKRDEKYVSLMQTFGAYGVIVRTMKRGDQLRLGELSISCLHPRPEYEWESENDYSLTLAVEFRDMRILCTGDLEESGERDLTDVCGPYDMLKVGHHGSKTSTSPEFLHKARLVNAVVSAGRKNRYGHPAAVTLEKLGQQGVRVWHTMEQGAIFLEWKNGGKQIYSFREGGI